MGRSIPSRTLPSISIRPSFARLTVLGVAVLLIGSLALLIGQPQPAAAHGWSPRVQFVGSDVTPTPRPPRPEINPVSADDDAVVRPDAATDEDVSGLPTSGIGVTNPADANVQRWTNLAIAALALNAVILFAVAIWTMRRRRL